MIRYLAHRLLVMVPTLVVISALVFVIIQLPEGDFLTSQIAELEAQGETVNRDKIEFLRIEYGLDRPPVERYLRWLGGMLHGDFGYSFEHRLPVNEVVGDRLFLTFLVSFATIVFTWLVSFPIGVYSATHQYSAGDHALTFLGFIGLATPNFLLALVLLYFANVYFGTSIGGPDGPRIPRRAHELGQVRVGARAPVDPGGGDRDLRHGGNDPAPAGEPPRRAPQAVRRDRAREGHAAHPPPPQVPPYGWPSTPSSRTSATSCPRWCPGRRWCRWCCRSRPPGPMLIDALRSQDMYLAGSFLMFLAALTVVGMFLSDLALAALDPRIRFEGGRR